MITVRPATAQDLADAQATDARGEAALARLQAKYEQSLDLYGVVLAEQSQQPIAGAQVSLEPIVHANIGAKESPPVFVQTDAQGRFAYTGHRGAYLYVTVSKEGFYKLDGRSNAFFTHDAPDAYMQQRSFAPDPAQPARFFLRAHGTPAPGLVSHNLSKLLPRDGSPAEIRLATGNVVAVDGGDVRIACSGTDRGIPGGTPYNWSCQISVPGGGLQVRTDEFTFTAPEGGYQSGEQIDMSASLGKQRWHDFASRDYFLHLANGHYARMKIEIIPGGDHFFVGTCYYNPTPGDRNLEAGLSADSEYR